jgi:hypothetical protein
MRSVPRSLTIEETHSRYFSARTSRLLTLRCYIDATAHEAHATEGATND